MDLIRPWLAVKIWTLGLGNRTHRKSSVYRTCSLRTTFSNCVYTYICTCVYMCVYIYIYYIYINYIYTHRQICNQNLKHGKGRNSKSQLPEMFHNFSIVMILFQIHGIGYNPCTILKFNAFKSQGLQSLRVVW